MAKGYLSRYEPY